MERGTDNIAEEIADVEIMLHKFKIMFDCYDAAERQCTKRLCELRVRADEYSDRENTETRLRACKRTKTIQKPCLRIAPNARNTKTEIAV